jgi:hypothetical protein
MSMFDLDRRALRAMFAVVTEEEQERSQAHITASDFATPEEYTTLENISECEALAMLESVSSYVNRYKRS